LWLLLAAIGKNPSEASVPLGMVGGQAITSSANFLGSLILGFVLSWAIILVGFAPLLLLAPIAYCLSLDRRTPFHSAQS
jgi:hypothetical protein